MTIKDGLLDLVKRELLIYILRRADGSIGEYISTAYESLRHSKWVCKYHVVFIPKGARSSCMVKSENF